jgi:iron(III) transport system ATP-binding protein
MFLGGSLDFQVEVGESVLPARVHPSVQTPTGDPIHLRMRAQKYVAIA